MKKLSILLLSFLILFTSCIGPKYLKSVDTETKKSEVKVVKRYGIVNQQTKKDDVKYQVSAGNIIWSILLVETIVVPVVLIGWYLWVPVDLEEKKDK